jgi:hypothetical protein
MGSCIYIIFGPIFIPIFRQESGTVGIRLLASSQRPVEVGAPERTGVKRRKPDLLAHRNGRAASSTGHNSLSCEQRIRIQKNNITIMYVFAELHLSRTLKVIKED